MRMTSRSVIVIAAAVVPKTGEPPAKQVHTDPKDHQAGDQAHPWIQLLRNDVT